MAEIAATIIWEITENGSYLNGGGFNSEASGEDYSTANSAHASPVDVDTTGGTTLTSASGFTTDDYEDLVGNVIHLFDSSDNHLGWYEITAAASANSITVNTAPASGTNRKGYVGGAFDLGNTKTDAEFFAMLVDGNKVYIKYATYTMSETITLGTGNEAEIEGYYSTRGDEPTGTDRPTLDFGATFSLTIANTITCNLKNLIITGKATNVLSAAGSGEIYLVNCKIANTSDTADRRALLISYGSIIGCEIYSTNGIAVFSNAYYPLFFACYIHDSDVGFYINAGYPIIIGSVIDTCTTYGVDAGTVGEKQIKIINSTIYSCGTGIFSDADSVSTGKALIINSIIDSCTTGVNGAGTLNFNHYVDFNCWNDNTADIAGDQFEKGSNAVNEDPEMSSPSTGIFTIGTTSEASNEALDASTYTSCSV